MLDGVLGARDWRSWRVRLKLAQKFSILCQKLQPDQTSQFIVTHFGNLLRDTEQEARAAAALAEENWDAAYLLNIRMGLQSRIVVCSALHIRYQPLSSSITGAIHRGLW